MFWVISVYFNVRNILPKSGTFPPGHPVYYMYVYVHLFASYVGHTEYWSFNAIFRCVRKITAESDYKLCHVCLSVRMEQHGSHCTEFVQFYVGDTNNISLLDSKFA